MHKCQLYPVVIYIRHKSLKQVRYIHTIPWEYQHSPDASLTNQLYTSRDVKDPKFLPERLSSRSAKDLFDYFQKVEMDYKNLFTGDYLHICH